MAWFAPLSSSVSCPTCSIFFALVTAMFESLSLRLIAPAKIIGSAQCHACLCARGSFHSRSVNRDTRSHGGAQVATLDVLALRHRGLCLDDAGNHCGGVLHQF